MRILVLHLHDGDFQMGGADKGVLALSLALQAIAGNELRILTNAGPFAETARKQGLNVVEIPHQRILFFLMLQTIRAEVSRFRPDLFHSHHRFTTFLLDLFMKGKGVPILHTQRVQTRDKRFWFRFGDYMTTVSESLRRHMISFYHVPEKRIRAVVNAVACRTPDQKAVETLRQKFPRKEGELFALCAGRFHEQKGHAYLIEAVDKMDAALRNRVRIFLAGDGPLEQALKKKIEEKNLQANFVFTGYLEDISDYLELCDFLILPSLWEGLPRTILESFSLGRPVIATNIPGTADVLEHQKNGWLVPPARAEELSSAIRYFIEHPQELVKMREGAKESSAKYSFETMVRHYQELYGELIQEFSKAGCK